MDSIVGLWWPFLNCLKHFAFQTKFTKLHLIRCLVYILFKVHLFWNICQNYSEIKQVPSNNPIHKSQRIVCRRSFPSPVKSRSRISETRCQLPGGGGQPIILQNAETTWKWKNLDREGGARSLRPPPGSTSSEAGGLVNSVLSDQDTSWMMWPFHTTLGNPRCIWSSLMRLYASKLRAIGFMLPPFYLALSLAERKYYGCSLQMSDEIIPHWLTGADISVPVCRGWTDLWQITYKSNIST